MCTHNLFLAKKEKYHTFYMIIIGSLLATDRSKAVVLV